MTKASSAVRIGDVLLVKLPEQNPQGREQEGLRPVVVMGVPTLTGAVREPLLVCVPLTSTPGQWAKDNPTLYPTVKAPLGGLTRDGIALIDQTRSIDPTRLVSYIGHLSDKQRGPLTEGLKQVFGLKGVDRG